MQSRGKPVNKHGLLEQLLALTALFFTILLLEVIAIDRLAAGPLTGVYWRRIKNGRR